MRYIFRELDKDKDGWPEGLGNVEREGMGAEKLDNTVYTIRGLTDLAEIEGVVGDVGARGGHALARPAGGAGQLVHVGDQQPVGGNGIHGNDHTSMLA